MKKITNKTSDKPIPAHQALATELWYEGVSSTEIAKEIQDKYGIKFADSTIRWWFSDTGPLESYYDDYANQQNKVRLRKVQDTFKANADKAVGALAMVMSARKGYGAAQAIAAEKWLDRALGKVTDKQLLIHGDINTFAEWAELQQEQINNEQTKTISEGAD